MSHRCESFQSNSLTLVDKVEQLHTVTRVVQTIAIASSSFFVFVFLIYAFLDVDDYEYLHRDLFNLTYHVCITAMLLLNGFSAFTMIAHCVALQSKYHRIVSENYCNIFAIDFYHEYIEETQLLRTLSQICTVVSFFLLYVALILFTLCTTAFSLQTFIFSVAFAIGLLCNIASALKIFGFVDRIPCQRGTSTHHLKRTLHLSAHQLASQTFGSSSTLSPNVLRGRSKSDDHDNASLKHSNDTMRKTSGNEDGRSDADGETVWIKDALPTLINSDKRSFGLSVTTEMTPEDTNSNEFDSRELAMLTVASGNVFDYRTDVIHEEEDEHDDEHEQEHKSDGDSQSGLFPYVNADGVEETEEDDDEEDVAISEYKDDQSGSSETTVEHPTPPHMQSSVAVVDFTPNGKSDIVEEAVGEDVGDADGASVDSKLSVDPTVKSTTKDAGDEDHANAELIDVISKAISNENNRSRELTRQSTESMLDNAHDLLHGLSGVISLGSAQQQTIGGFFSGMDGAEQGDEDEEEESSYESGDQLQLDEECSLTDEYDQNATGNEYNLLTMFAKSRHCALEQRSRSDNQAEDIKRFYAE